jgi:hypothetical protein
MRNCYMNGLVFHPMKICKCFNMKIFTAILTCLALSGPLHAQEDDGLKKVEAARIALITERLDLSPEQAEKFWPLYREYVARKQELRKEFLDARRDVNGKEMSEEESKKLLNKGLELKERQLALDKLYSERFNNVITTRQILALRKAEEDFRQMLLDRLEKRRDARDRLNRRDDLKNNN